MLKVFTLFDSAAAAYMAPFYLPTAGVAIRQLQEAKADPKSALSQHAQDFTLYELGTFDPATGIHTLHQAPVRVLALNEVLV